MALRTGSWTQASVDTFALSEMMLILHHLQSCLAY